MRFAYADPPYLGQARKHYGREAAKAGRTAREVNHALLLAHLREFDGWALSLSSVSLLTIARLQLPDGSWAVPEGARVGAWVKPFAVFKPNVNPGYCWEPVVFMPARNLGRDVPTVRDYLSANVTLMRGVSGAKPDAFGRWIFDLLGMQQGDEFHDLFPGSGAVGRAWEQWRDQGRLIA